MANWYGSARSNYFHVNDLDAFKTECDRLSIHYWEEKNADGPTGAVGIYAPDGEGWPSSAWDSEINDSIDFDVVDVVQEHLKDGEVCILMEIGAENLRYLSGRALAISRDEVGEVDLEAIYEIAKKMTDRPKDVTRAEY